MRLRSLSIKNLLDQILKYDLRLLVQYKDQGEVKRG